MEIYFLTLRAIHRQMALTRDNNFDPVRWVGISAQKIRIQTKSNRVVTTRERLININK